MRNEILQGDCLELMKNIPTGSIDMICADLPYGITQNHWDRIIDMDALWSDYKRIIKDNGAILLFGQGLFSARLMLSNEKMYRYTLIWEKTSSGGFFNAKKMPLRSHEDILVFYKKLPVYNPQKTTGNKPVNSYTKHTSDGSNYGKSKTGISGGGNTERYPRSILKFATDKQKSNLAPTQKPVPLLRYLVRTFSNEGNIVLDNCAGSGSTGEACILENRGYILMEKEPEMFEIMKNRIENVLV